MAKYYGISQSTDMRCPHTKIFYLGYGNRGKTRASEWIKSKVAHFTYDDPGAARNYHHTLYDVYEMPSGWRAPSEKKMIAEALRRSSTSYPRYKEDVFFDLIRKDGTRVIE